ncbi:MAG: ATP-binding protein [Mycobacterium sp.]
MTDGEHRATTSTSHRSDRTVEFRVSARLENLAVVRTLVSAVGTFEDLDFDAVADLRLAVDEACTRLIRSSAPDATLVVVVHPSETEVVVEASATCHGADVVTPGSFSWHVLTSLTDEVTTFTNGQGVDGANVVGIALTTRRVSPAR